MKNLILIFLTLIILVGCSTSSLKLNKDKKLVLKYNSSDLLLANKIIDSSFLNFKDLFVTIYKLEDENGRVLFYEDARTSLNFEFVERGLYSVMYIFNNIQRYDIVYERNNLKLVQFALKDKRYLNIIIQASNSQIYSYAYGFSNKEFMKIAKKIKTNDSNTIEKLKHEGLVFNNTSEAISNWNDELVFFTPLIAPLRTMSGA